MPDPTGLSAEDAKLVVLARSARARAHTPGGEPAEGAAVRDTDGRTYAAATVGHSTRPDLTTSAVRGALSAFASSGARVLEAVVLVGAESLAEDDKALIAEFGAGVPVHLAAPDGSVRATLTAAGA